MAQADLNLSASQSGIDYTIDINAIVQALATMSSGNTAPASPVALQVWADTNTSLLKLRNGANTAWIDLFPLDRSLTTFVNEILSGTGIGTTAPLLPSDNLNSTGNTGIYRITTSTSNNSLNGNGFVLMVKRDASTFDQLIYSYTNQKLRARTTLNNGTLWTDRIVLESTTAPFTGTYTFTGNKTFDDSVTVNDGFLALQGGKPFGYESIPKPVQTASNLFEVKINGTIQATLFNPTTSAYQQFYGSNLTIANNGTVGVAGSIDATRVSGQMYYLWLIGKNDGTLAGLFSASNTAPTMPTGYTWRRLLPWSCATYPPNATYTNGSGSITDITGSGREGAFIEHLVSNWGRDGGNNPIITYISRFPNNINLGAGSNNGTNAPTLVSYNKGYSSSFYIENLACMNVTLSGQPMWLVPPEVEAVGLHIKGASSSNMIIGVETFNGSGAYTTESFPWATNSSDTSQTPLFPVTSRRMRFANNVTSAHIGVREFRCSFTNFWL
jgi:hypothetical protein